VAWLPLGSVCPVGVAAVGERLPGWRGCRAGRIWGRNVWPWRGSGQAGSPGVEGGQNRARLTRSVTRVFDCSRNRGEGQQPPPGLAGCVRFCPPSGGSEATRPGRVEGACRLRAAYGPDTTTARPDTVACHMRTTGVTPINLRRSSLEAAAWRNESHLGPGAHTPAVYTRVCPPSPAFGQLLASARGVWCDPSEEPRRADPPFRETGAPARPRKRNPGHSGGARPSREPASRSPSARACGPTRHPGCPIGPAARRPARPRRRLSTNQIC
jgi:hypothetical protein